MKDKGGLSQFLCVDLSVQKSALLSLIINWKLSELPLELYNLCVSVFSCQLVYCMLGARDRGGRELKSDDTI